MSVIHSQNVHEIIRRTLSIINPKIITHGEIVGYMLYKMLEADGRYSMQEMLDYAMLGVLHDIGLYREEGLNNVADFETAGSPWPHSVYGFLFLKYLSPIGDKAEIVLYHHLDYNRYGSVKSKYAHITECLALADKMDNFMRCEETRMKGDYFVRYRNIQFSGDALNLFYKAEKEYGITAKLASGEYRQEMNGIMSCGIFSEEYKRRFLEMLVYSIDFRSEHTVVHTMSTVNFAMQLGRLMGVGTEELQKMYYGALLHDLGKIAIPLEILEAPGRLNEEDMRIMKAHVRITEMILSGLVDEDVLRIAARHHEKLDGTGYHKGLSEEELTLPQQIVAVADILSALYGKRSYKDSFDSEKIKGILLEDAGNHKISKGTVECLMAHYDAVIQQYEEQKDETIGLYLRIKQQYDEIRKRLEGIVP
ncbi:MAG TPA: phosphohydrolase [Lachnospiraceae bacterium]|nr:phosphohydrolase [Lachnospiraceae bacterium]